MGVIVYKQGAYVTVEPSLGLLSWGPFLLQRIKFNPNMDK